MLAEPVPMVRRTRNNRSHPAPDAPSGVLLIDKPPNITSHDVVDHIRKLYHTRRVGHTGTLDPMASGLMLVLLGKATKIAPYLSALSKRYLASICFGSVSDTGDAEGHITPAGDPSGVTLDSLNAALAALVGESAQRIPAYSAVRSGGRRLYELARSGAEVPALERVVTIHSADLVSFSGDTADVRIGCSSGTYIRALAGSLGEAVGCGAYLCGLRREAVGQWLASDAFSLETLHDFKERNHPLPVPAPIEQYLNFPRLEIAPQSRELITHGSPLTAAHVVAVGSQFQSGDTVLVIDAGRQVLAIGTALVGNDELSVMPASDPVVRYRRVLI